MSTKRSFEVLVSFPSPCGELRVADGELMSTKRSFKTFPSPCGELRVADVLLNLKQEEEVFVSVPLRGIEGS